MEPILVLLGSWWWVAPAVVGAGAASYSALTVNRRRARRLELDAARHEETQAHRALIAAKAHVREAQADVLSARAGARPSLIDVVLPPTDPGSNDARGRLFAAKQAEKSASLALRASRTRIKAAYAQYRAAGSSEPLPLERLVRAHDEINLRWIAYETDPDRALAHPQMVDSTHPATIAFLEAQREASHLRPADPHARMTPAEFSAYRAAVQRLAALLADAEVKAGAAPRPSLLPPWAAGLDSLWKSGILGTPQRPPT